MHTGSSRDTAIPGFPGGFFRCEWCSFAALGLNRDLRMGIL
jgi:hypothetical protein